MLEADRSSGNVAVALVAAAGLLAACGQNNSYVPPPPPKVTVAAPIARQITRYLDATGSSEAVNTVDLVARVAGFVQSIGYADGDLVKKGTILFTIEPETYDLKLKGKQAAEDGARASLKGAEADFKRQKELESKGVASEAKFDETLAKRDNADATLRQAQVDTKLAATDVQYAHVAAPFDGEVTARKVSVGEYVSSGSSSPTKLATIVQLDPIHVNFTVPERDVLEIRERLRRQGVKPEDLKGKIPVEIALQNESGYPHKGTLDYVSPQVDASTGTVTARAIFDNADRVLLPGLFVRLRIPFPQKLDALLVPDTALGTDQGGRYLLVVGKDDTAEQRKVETGPAEGGLRVITSGLKPDDRVIVAGIQRAIPGQKVDPQPAAPAVPAATK